MLSQLNGLQVIKKKRDLPFFTAVSFNLLARLPRPVPFTSRENQTPQRQSRSAEVNEHRNVIKDMFVSLNADLC